MYPWVIGLRWLPSIFTTRPSCTWTSRLQASGQSRGQALGSTWSEDSGRTGADGAERISVMTLILSLSWHRVRRHSPAVKRGAAYLQVPPTGNVIQEPRDHEPYRENDCLSFDSFASCRLRARQGKGRGK